MSNIFSGSLSSIWLITLPTLIRFNVCVCVFWWCVIYNVYMILFWLPICCCQISLQNVGGILNLLMTLFAWSMGHRLRNTTVVCLWPSSPSLSWSIPFSWIQDFQCIFYRWLFSLSLPLLVWRMIVFGGILSMCPIHLHFLFIISFYNSIYLIQSQSICEIVYDIYIYFCNIYIFS